MSLWWIGLFASVQGAEPGFGVGLWLGMSLAGLGVLGSLARLVFGR